MVLSCSPFLAVHMESITLVQRLPMKLDTGLVRQLVTSPHMTLSFLCVKILSQLLALLLWFGALKGICPLDCPLCLQVFSIPLTVAALSQMIMLLTRPRKQVLNFNALIQHPAPVARSPRRSHR